MGSLWRSLQNIYKSTLTLSLLSLNLHCFQSLRQIYIRRHCLIILTEKLSYLLILCCSFESNRLNPFFLRQYQDELFRFEDYLWLIQVTQGPKTYLFIFIRDNFRVFCSMCLSRQVLLWKRRKMECPTNSFIMIDDWLWTKL